MEEFEIGKIVGKMEEMEYEVEYLRDMVCYLLEMVRHYVVESGQRKEFLKNLLLKIEKDMEKDRGD